MAARDQYPDLWVTDDDGTRRQLSDWITLLRKPEAAAHPGLYNFKPGNLKKWRKAMAGVRSGTAIARVALPGDSTTFGEGAGTGTSQRDGARPKAWPAQVASILAGGGLPTSTNSLFGSGGLTDAQYLAYDPRLVLGAGWSGSGAGSQPSMGGNAWMNSTTTNALAFTPADPFDTIEFYYVQNTGMATFTVDVDGGAALTTINAAGVAGLIKGTVTCPLGTHTVNIKRTGVGGQLYVTGMDPYNSAIRKVSIYNLGVPGHRASNANYTANVWNTGNTLPIIAPDLTISNYGINDAAQAITTASFMSDYQAQITKAKQSGDVILLVPIPSATTQVAQSEQDRITQAIYDLATANDLPVIDLKQRVGSYDDANALGLYDDTLHGNALLYADVGHLVAKALLI